ncbi:MAG: phosphatase PAP2 family protein [Clostridia bacterium]|nr:phosphatase PAP2 family protein [Clostridia bacterium]
MFDAIQNIDFAILDFIVEHIRCGFLDAVMPAISSFADHGIGWIAIAVILLFFKKTRKAGAAMGVALIFGLIVGNATLKPLVGRIRPYDINTTVPMLVERLSDFSFPSGHTLASFEGGVVLFIKHRKIGIAAMVLAVLIAFSRLYLYVHFPSDVIVGAILGTIFAVLGCVIMDKVWAAVETKLAAKKAA